MSSWEIVLRLRELIDRHTTVSGEHPVTVAELRYALDPGAESWDPGTPTRIGTCSTGCEPGDFE